jgi:ATP-dependent DNA ligase
MTRSLAGSRRAEPMALPSWIKPQLTKLVDRPPDGPEWLHEIKFDGYRMHARLDRGAVRLLTRTGLDSTHKYPAIAAAVASLPATSVRSLKALSSSTIETSIAPIIKAAARDGE